MTEALKLALITLVTGAGLVASQAVFLTSLYRLAEFHPTRLERRRLVFSLAWKFLLMAVAAAFISAGMNLIWAIALGVSLVGIPVVAASYALRGRHWLFTLAADETAAVEGRRERLMRVRRRPAFWLLVGSYMLVVPVMTLAIILGLAHT